MGAVGTTPYTSVAISGYNATPPADDGSAVASNQLQWSKHKSKLADPIKTLGEAINTNLVAAFAKSVNTDAGVRNQLSGSLAFEWATATIGTDTLDITIPTSLAVGAQAGATSDTLQNLSATGVYSGALTFIQQRNATEEINVIHATSTRATATAPNIYLQSSTATNPDYLLDGPRKRLVLQYDDQVATATGWYEVARSTHEFTDTNGLVLLDSAAASASSTVELDQSIDATYNVYMITISDMVCATDDSELWMRVLDSTYQADVADYAYAGTGIDTAGATPNAPNATVAGGAAQILLTRNTGTHGLGNAAGESLNATIWMYSPAGSLRKKFYAQVVYDRAAGEIFRFTFVGAYIGATNAITGIRFLMDSGNITSGEFRLYGVKDS